MSNDTRDNRNEPRVVVGFQGRHQIVPGLVLVAIGALFLLGNLHIVNSRDWFEYWPVILIAIGLVQLVDASYVGGRIAGGVLMGVGGLFLADNLGYLRFDIGDLWPLILIAVGVAMLMNRTGLIGSNWWHGRIRTWRHNWDDTVDTGDTYDSRGFIHEVSIFGGSKRTVVAQDFQGGRVASIFGGISLDLTRANISGDKAKIDVSAIYGGVSIRVPSTWSVEARGAGIFGGFADHTNHPVPGPDTKVLIVRGAGVFGGVVIKN